MLTLTGFNLVIERLLISGWHRFLSVSRLPPGFNLVIERLLISGYGGVACPPSALSFNLVIERLLISGQRVHCVAPRPI